MVLNLPFFHQLQQNLQVNPSLFAIVKTITPLAEPSGFVRAITARFTHSKKTLEYFTKNNYYNYYGKI